MSVAADWQHMLAAVAALYAVTAAGVLPSAGGTALAFEEGSDIAPSASSSPSPATRGITYAPATCTVSGAGSKAANGNYTWTEDGHEGAIYSKDGYTADKLYQWKVDQEWKLGKFAKFLYYEAKGASSVPPAADQWKVVGKGMSPPPQSIVCRGMTPPPPSPPPSPTPPTPPAPPANGGQLLPSSVACITVLSINTSKTQYCAGRGEARTSYSVLSPRNTSWVTTLRRSDAPTVTLTGWAAVEQDLTLNASVFTWVLTTASSTDGTVRALDLGFAFVGLPAGVEGAQLYTTGQSKSWGPPVRASATGWKGASVSCTVGKSCDAESIRKQTPPAPHHSMTWHPPHPLPEAMAALFQPGRGAFAGGTSATGKAGYAGWSSQPTLPFQTFAKYTNASLSLSGDAVQQSGKVAVELSSGVARIHTNLRCGDVLPVTLKWGVFSDLTEDSKLDENDAVVWTREQHPKADYVYRSSLVLAIAVDEATYIPKGHPVPQMPRISFNETLGVVRTLASWSDNTSTILRLVGWQGSGHDTLFPSLNQINPKVGTLADLQRLSREALNYNTIITYDMNTDDAYANFTATQCSGFNQCDDSIHPVPGTQDGLPNPDFKREIMSLTPSGDLWQWCGSLCATRTDPLQGPAYHLSKTKDTASGERHRRFTEFLAIVPFAPTIHCDANHDVSDSWETDARGFIAEDEEGICGLLADHNFWASKGISSGVEGDDGALLGVGPVMGWSTMVSYFWAGSGDEHVFGSWNRIVMGTQQGSQRTVHGGNGTSGQMYYQDGQLKGIEPKSMYQGAMVYMMQMTDELISGSRFNGRFRRGGNGTHWPFAKDWIEYCKLPGGKPGPDGAIGVTCAGSVFIPAVLPPPAGSPQTAPTTLSLTKFYTFGADESWTLPLNWVGREVHARAIGAGAVAPKVAVIGRTLTLTGMQKGTPVVLTIEE